MTQFHSLASFVFGCGFDDADLECNTTSADSPTSSTNFNSNNISDLLLFTQNVNSAPPSPPSNSLTNLNGLLNESTLNETTSSLIDQSLIDPMITESDQTTKIESVATTNLTTKETNQLSNQDQQNQQANTLEILMIKMQNLSEQKQQQIETDNQDELVKNQSLEIHLTPTQTLTNEFSYNNGSPTNNSNLSANNSGQQTTATTNQPTPVDKLPGKIGNDEIDMDKFVIDSKFCYADFARQRARTDISTEICTFRVQDYSWSDHAYSLVNRLYNDIGNMLDEKFTTTYYLTYYT